MPDFSSSSQWLYSTIHNSPWSPAPGWNPSRKNRRTDQYPPGYL